MKARLTGIPIRSLSIRMLVVLWAGSLFLAWVVLMGGWFVAKSKLARIDQRVALDAEALEAAHELETDVLTERYDDLLWKATGQSMYTPSATPEYRSPVGPRRYPCAPWESVRQCQSRRRDSLLR